MTATQTSRLRAYLIAHPASSSLEIIAALALTNATGRLSDLRDELAGSGFQLVKEKRSDGRWGYRLEPVSDGTLFGIAS